jgi:hypothetical protein
LASDGTTLHGETSAVTHKRVAFAALQHRDFRWFFVTTMLAMMAVTFALLAFAAPTRGEID